MSARRRQYRDVTVVAGDGDYAIALDGRAARTPAGRVLCVRSPRLAEAIVTEWSAQRDVIAPQTMPMTQLTVTALDRVAPRRWDVVQELVGYGGTDLLCYRASKPADLAARQQAVWQPLLDWAGTTWGVRLRVGSGIMPIEQPETALSALESVVAALDDMELTALANLVQATGSVIIGLALVYDRLTSEAAFVTAELDADHQIEQWGETPEISERRRRLRGDLDAAQRFLGLLGRDRRQALGLGAIGASPGNGGAEQRKRIE